jgi:hypothetical protein
MARFQIHRLDDPRADDQHYRAFWRIDGRTFRVHVWSLKEWLRIPWADRPRDARPLKGPGWMTVRPMRETEATQAECQEQQPENLSPLPVSNRSRWTRSRN